MWAEGTAMEKGQKIKVSEKDSKKQVVTSKTVQIEPCVNTK